MAKKKYWTYERFPETSFAWKIEPKDHGNYTDLGNYVLDLGEITMDDVMMGIAEVNRRQDLWPAGGCTAIVKRNAKGEVIVGRNQDMEVSNYPAYISHFTGGKYRAVGIFYDNKGKITYDQYKAGADLPRTDRAAFAMVSTDAFNEKGLYIQTNMRTSIGVKSSGTNPDGLRVGEISVGALVAQNAATVKEAVEYARSLNIYSMGDPNNPMAWGFAFLIGDAEGDYGILEFADNNVYFTPYANGHANYFVAPEMVANDPLGAGYGRLAFALRYLPDAEDEYQMQAAIHEADWVKEIRDLEYSYRDEDGKVHFVDKDGNPSIDFRTELTGNFSVGYLGEVVDENEEGPAQLKGFLSYYQDYTEEMETIEFLRKLSYHLNCTKEYLLDSNNFETAKEQFKKVFSHPYEVFERYMAGDEKPLRDIATYLTTGLCVGVNCAKKHMILRFFEKDEYGFDCQWD